MKSPWKLKYSKKKRMYKLYDKADPQMTVYFSHTDYDLLDWLKVCVDHWYESGEYERQLND